MDPTPRRDAPDRLLVGVSLKMYLDPPTSVAWSRAVARIADDHAAIREGAAELFVLPSLPSLAAVRDVLGGSPVALGAQDLFWEDRGAFTGGVSGADLKALGCEYVEVGHAERRRWFGEDEVTVNRKLAAALRNGLVPVLCVGERRQDGPDAAIRECLAQLESAVGGVAGPDGGAAIVVAYEPEWAIGAREPAPAEHVSTVAAGIAAHLAAHAWLAGGRVIYGGSAGPGLLPRLGEAVRGLFLGRFAHDPAALGLILDDVLTMRQRGPGRAP